MNIHPIRFFFAPLTSKFRQKKCKKKAEMQEKSRKCTFDFKIHAKKGQKCKKKQKMHFNFEIHTKKIKNGKKKAHLFGFFRLLYPLCIFLHFKPKNSYKKKTKMQKKAKKNFQIAKIHMQKKAWNIISKKHAKKSINAKKKTAKKAYRVYLVYHF